MDESATFSVPQTGRSDGSDPGHILQGSFKRVPLSDRTHISNDFESRHSSFAENDSAQSDSSSLDIADLKRKSGSSIKVRSVFVILLDCN